MKAPARTEPTRNHDGNRRVEVIVTETDAGGRQVVVQDLSYGLGVGWFVQKSIRLDAAQVEAVLRALCCAKQECAKQECVSGHGASGQNAIPAARAGEGGAQIIQLSRCTR